MVGMQPLVGLFLLSLDLGGAQPCRAVHDDRRRSLVASGLRQKRPVVGLRIVLRRTLPRPECRRYLALCRNMPLLRGGQEPIFSGAIVLGHTIPIGVAP